jgi:general secretion pathway protein G
MKRRDNNRVKRSRGITLIELLVVMVILGIIATLVTRNTVSKIDDARRSQAKNQIVELEGALDLFRLDAGRYPTTEEGLEALRIKPSGLQNWDGPYLRKDVPKDPWDRPYIYRQPGQHGDFDLVSYGPDGQEGGEGESADLVNW